MSNLIISIFGNQIFEEIISELIIFSKYKIRFIKNINLSKRDLDNKDQLIIFLFTEDNKKYYEEIIKSNIPLIIISSNLMS